MFHVKHSVLSRGSFLENKEMPKKASIFFKKSKTRSKKRFQLDVSRETLRKLQTNPQRAFAGPILARRVFSEPVLKVSFVAKFPNFEQPVRLGRKNCAKRGVISGIFRRVLSNLQPKFGNCSRIWTFGTVSQKNKNNVL